MLRVYVCVCVSIWLTYILTSPPRIGRSTLQHFPLHHGRLVDLYNAVGRNPSRQVLVVWGEEDSMCDCEEGMEEMSRCFSQAGKFLAVPGAGRYTLIENFPVVAKEVLNFLKANTTALRKSLRGY